MLTDTAIKALKPREALYRVADMDGLALEITPNGSRLWRFRFRHPDTGKQQMLALGRYPDLSLAQARRVVAGHREALAGGAAPVPKRERVQAAAAAQTFADIAREWQAAQAVKGQAPATRKKHDMFLQNDILPLLGAKLPGEISAADIRAMVTRIAGREAFDVAKRAFNIASRILSYACAHGHAPRNPAADLTLSDLLARPPAQHHAAITDPAALAGLLRAIADYPHPLTRAALQLAALTFVRPGELRHATWGEFDLDKAEWCIPAERMKMRRPHVVPLAPQAVAILRALPRIGTSPYLFPSERTGSRPMSENTVNAALRRMGYAKDEMTGHGFRATARTLLHEQLAQDPVLIELQLAHRMPGALGDTYARAQFLPERRRMMATWADYLDGL